MKVLALATHLLAFTRFLMLLANIIFLVFSLWMIKILGAWMSLPSSLSSDILRFHMLLTTYICGIRVEFQVLPPRDPEKTILLVANHVSYLDIIAIGSQLPVAFMAKAELARWPLVSQVVRFSQGIFVNRNSARSRVKAAFKLAKTLRGRSICVFPEGTTTRGGPCSKDHWHSGWLSAGRRASCSLLVCGLAYQDAARAPWIGDMSFLPHLWQELRSLQTFIVVHGQEYPTSIAGLSPRGLGERMRLQLTEHIFAAQSLLDMNRGWMGRYADFKGIARS